MRAKIKIVIDTGMIILVLLQMAYHLTGDSLHEWLGKKILLSLFSHIFKNFLLAVINFCVAAVGELMK